MEIPFRTGARGVLDRCDLKSKLKEHGLILQSIDGIDPLTRPDGTTFKAFKKNAHVPVKVKETFGADLPANRVSYVLII